MGQYCTLQAARRQMTVGSTTDDAIYAAYIEPASDAIRDYCGRDFNEIYATYGFNGEVGAYNPTLDLQGRDLLSPTTVLNGDGSIIDPANYKLLPVGGYPKERVRIAAGNYWLAPNQLGSSCAYPSALLDKGYAEDAIQITGAWGFQRRYASAWQQIPQTVNGIHTASATTLNISANADAAFDVGSVLKITNANGTEYMAVTGPVSSSTKTGFATSAITVTRDYNNYTDTSRAIALNGGETIYVWKMEPVIELAATMITAALYQGRNNATGDHEMVPDIGMITIPVDLPPKVKVLLGWPYYNQWYGRA